MADPNASTQLGAGILGAALGATGLPLPVLLATTMGALIVVGNTKRVEWSREAITAALAAFGLALVLGFSGGQIVLWAAQTTWPGVPAIPVQVIGSLICAMFGQQKILPWLLGRMGKTIDGGEGEK
jgi:hypothetical protein